MKPNLEKYVKQFQNKFHNQLAVSTKSIREFYFENFPDSDENGYERFFYQLKKNKYITSSGSGIYIPQNPIVNRKSETFNPSESPFLKEVINKINENILPHLPYSQVVYWETRILHDFMIQQPVNNLLIVKTQKESSFVLFNYLSEVYPGRVFLFPEKKILNNYTFSNFQPIIIEKLITKSPTIKRKGNLIYSKIEQILVDVFVETETFTAYQGSELINIFVEIFQNFTIDENSLFNYAKRRNSETRLRQFIANIPSIVLLTSHLGEEK